MPVQLRKREKKMFANCIEAQNEFEKCWLNPDYTQITLADVDVNKTLMHYLVDKPLHFTRTMLWDMEKKKAWNPGKYIPYVIKEGSAKSWDKQSCSVTGGEMFVRTSNQKQWLHPMSYEEVYEEVYVNEREKLITFLGVKKIPDRDTELQPHQALFHVQHGVAGEETNPVNVWRIVHLTKSKDDQLIEMFKNLNDQTVLPGFIKEYIEKDLEIKIQHK